MSNDTVVGRPFVGSQAMVTGLYNWRSGQIRRIPNPSGIRLNLLDAQQTLLETRAQLAGDLGRRDSAQAASATIHSERRRTVQAFLADDMQKLADARKTADEQARDQTRLDRLTLRAPMAGRVQALSVTNLGQVVTAGQEVMRIVPEDAPLQVLAYITNEDIGFVRPGQHAVIKADSFPFTRFGTIDAEVVSVARNALPADQANHATTDIARVGGVSLEQPSATPMTNLVFETTLKLSRFAVSAEHDISPLSAGMTVAGEIRTGRRTIMAYFLDTLLNHTSEAIYER